MCGAKQKKLEFRVPLGPSRRWVRMGGGDSVTSPVTAQGRSCAQVQVSVPPSGFCETTAPETAPPRSRHSQRKDTTITVGRIRINTHPVCENTALKPAQVCGKQHTYWVGFTRPQGLCVVAGIVGIMNGCLSSLVH